MVRGLKLNSRGMVDLLRSDGVHRDLRARAGRIAAVAGRGMAVDSEVSRTRARAWVWTDTFDAMTAEATDRRLTRSIDAGRG